MNELVDDMFPIIFQYLSQSELINIFLLNKKINANVMRYINNNILIIRDNKKTFNDTFINACKNDCLISIRKYIIRVKKFVNKVEARKKIFEKCILCAFESMNIKYCKIFLKYDISNEYEIFNKCIELQNIPLTIIMLDYVYNNYLENRRLKMKLALCLKILHKDNYIMSSILKENINNIIKQLK